MDGRFSSTSSLEPDIYRYTYAYIDTYVRVHLYLLVSVMCMAPTLFGFQYSPGGLKRSHYVFTS